MSIEVENITKTYGNQKALDQISFKIKRGEIVGFLGPNGAGKSTMMKILTTYLQANEGRAVVNGFDVGTEKNKVQQSIGYLPEHNPLYLDMYIREYLEFNANIYGAAKSRIEEVIEMTGLTSESHKKINQLSKGYRQRVGLAASLIHEPEVLILDEPTTGLDPNQLLEIRELIKSIGKEKTVMFSTHIMNEVEAVCDRVIIINHGKIVADKKISELKGGSTQQIVVEFDYRVEPQLIEKLPKVTSVSNTKGFIYEISFDTKKDMRPGIFDFAHDNGLKILQLNQKNRNLEDLFHELTS